MFKLRMILYNLGNTKKSILQTFLIKRHFFYKNTKSFRLSRLADIESNFSFFLLRKVQRFCINYVK